MTGDGRGVRAAYQAIAAVAANTAHATAAAARNAGDRTTGRGTNPPGRTGDR